MSHISRIFTLGGLATLGVAVSASLASAGPINIDVTAKSRDAIGPDQIVGTYGTAHTYGTSGGVNVDADLKSAETLYLTFNGVSFPADETTHVDVYIVKGYDWATSVENELSMANFVGSIAGQPFPHSHTITSHTLEINDFTTSDSAGQAKTFLKSADGAKINVVLITRTGSMTFSSIKIDKSLPEATYPAAP